MLDDWHSLSVKALLSELQTTDEGLTEDEVNKRLRTYGYNELLKKKKKHPIFTFIDQFRDPLVIILLAALAISISIGIVSHDPQEKFEYFFDSIAITAIVLFNALFGFIQEYKAEKSIEALKSMAAPSSTVIRNGKKQRIEARLLVPGDIIIIEEGDRIPADSRLIQAVSLRVDESTLTGESFPVAKDVSDNIDRNATLGDRTNSLFSGTIVTRGRGQAVIVRTGMETEFGRIAKGLMEEGVEETPLQRRLSTLGKWLGLASLLICGVIFFIGVLLDQGIINMFIVSVGLAVAAVPEGLPAVVTLALALGVQRMSKKNAIIRRLPSVETLGSTTVICSDKTGTLTENKMTVRKILTTDTKFTLSGELKLDSEIKTIINIGLACNNAQIASGTDRNAVDIGDPTEIALLKLASKYGMTNRYTRLYEIPFDSNAKRMSVVVKDENSDYYVFMKGAPDVLLKLCKYYFSNGEVRGLDEKTRLQIEESIQDEAQSGYRMLGMAYKTIPPEEIDVKLVSEDVNEIEADLIYIGSVAIMDPPRPGTKSSIETCIRAGIRPIMITGDHLKTAVAVANEIGLIDRSDNTQQYIEGTQLSEIDDDELKELVKTVNVYARVSPEHKLRLVNALKSNNEIVAMTGDGVNDAPALKRADIGVAMGISGTDVSKEAADMILADDDFSTIVAAILEGRTIYDNMRKFILYLLSCNAGEIMVMFLGIILTSFLFGEPILPLVAIQILWVNLVTDGLPALALGVDPPDADIMVRKPRDPNESIITRKSVLFIIYSGIVIGLLTLFIFLLYLPQNPDEITHARTMSFTLLIVFQMIMALNIRKEEHSLLGKEFFRNPYLLIAIASSIILHLIVVYVPFLNPFFDTIPLKFEDWVVILVFGSVLVIVDEIRTFISHHFKKLRNIAGYW